MRKSNDVKISCEVHMQIPTTVIQWTHTFYRYKSIRKSVVSTLAVYISDNMDKPTLFAARFEEEVLEV